MSKESRRRQRTAGQQSGARPGSGDDRSAAPIPSGGRPAASRPATAQRSPERAGRRERARPAPRGSFVQRYRSWLLAAAVVAVVAIVGAGVFAAATQPAFACSMEWVPDPTSSPAAGASPQPGYVQPDMGNAHVATGTAIRYTYCPPASGRHFNQIRCRTDRRPTLWSERQRDPTGLGPQPRAWRSRDPVPRRRGRSGRAPRALRRGPGEPGLRVRAGRIVARSCDRSIRPDGLAVRSHRVGSRAATRDARSGSDLRLLRALCRADEPGEALPGARPERRAEREWLRGAVASRQQPVGGARALSAASPS